METRANRDLTSGVTYQRHPVRPFFSKCGVIVESRLSLTDGHVVMLIRTQLDDPPAGTRECHDLTKAAMHQ